MPRIKQEKTREERISQEKKRLVKALAELEASRGVLASGLIDRAANLRIELEELEKYLKINGHTEMFSQGNQKPYSRHRPESQAYDKLLGDYTKIIDTLSRQLPKEVQTQEKLDLINEFAKSRKN